MVGHDPDGCWRGQAAEAAEVDALDEEPDLSGVQFWLLRRGVVVAMVIGADHLRGVGLRRPGRTDPTATSVRAPMVADSECVKVMADHMAYGVVQGAVTAFIVRGGLTRRSCLDDGLDAWSCAPGPSAWTGTCGRGTFWRSTSRGADGPSSRPWVGRGVWEPRTAPVGVVNSNHWCSTVPHGPAGPVDHAVVVATRWRERLSMSVPAAGRVLPVEVLSVSVWWQLSRSRRQGWWPALEDPVGTHGST